MIRFGLIGFGYWGPNLARNIDHSTKCQLVGISDSQDARQDAARVAFPQADVYADFKELIQRDDVDAVAIATPTATHFELAKLALDQGKDVLVEKPATETSAQARQLAEIADANQRLIAVDHTFLYTGAVRKIKSLLDEGELGELLYFDSVRVNLGLFQQDVNVIYDLAPHELSILDYIAGQPPMSVQAMGKAHLGGSHENIAYMHLEYETGMIAHIHMSWLAPVKVRRTLIAGSEKMIVYNDLEPDEKIRLYDKGVTLDASTDDSNKLKVDYRAGDVLSPKLDRTEALKAEIDHIAECFMARRPPLSDIHMGIRVMDILDAAQRSLQQQGARVPLSEMFLSTAS